MDSAGALMDEIEDGAINGKDLAQTLRRVLSLGGRAGSADLREWATKELKGYSVDDDLPGYRHLVVPLCIDGATPRGHVRGQRISPMELPEFARDAITESLDLRFGVGEIEALIRSTEAQGDSAAMLAPPGAVDLVLLWNHERKNPTQQVMAVYWNVSLASLHSVLDQVRTVLTELVAELRAGTPGGQRLPSPEVTQQAVSVVLHGKNHRVQVVHQASGGDSHAAPTGDEPEPRWWSAGRAAWATAIGLATLAGTYFAYLAVR